MRVRVAVYDGKDRKFWVVGVVAINIYIIVFFLSLFSYS